jgi:hypothetical protein
LETIKPSELYFTLLTFTFGILRYASIRKKFSASPRALQRALRRAIRRAIRRAGPRGRADFETLSIGATKSVDPARGDPAASYNEKRLSVLARV